MTGLILALAIATLIAVTAIALARRRWRLDTEELKRRLLALGAERRMPGVAETINDLPAPVARFLHLVLRAGQPVPRHVRIEWAGQFNLGRPDADKWVPFAATQDFVPAAPGFVWDARMKMAPGITVHVRDGYVAGQGSMHASVLGLVPIVNKAGGDALAAAALQRYLGEAIWLPAALLPGAGVRWEPIDDRRARATIGDAAASATLEFRFGTDGLVESVYTDSRTFDDGKHSPSQQAWQARVLRYGEFDGVKVPAEAVVEWLLSGGAYAYWRGRPLRIACDTAATQ